jgi:YYY domain-containing protein
VQLVGRFLSALVDLVAVFFTFLLARRLYDWRAGLFAALLLALAVMPIQQSHFFTMDNWATAFVTAGIYAAVRAATLGDAEPRWRLRWWALFGLALGLAAASRVNVAPLAVIIVVSAVIWLARRSKEAAGEQGSGGAGETVSSQQYSVFSNQNRDLERAVVGIALAAAVSILTFRLAQPYAFTDAQMVRDAAAAAGETPNAFIVALKSIIGLNPNFLANMAEIQRLQAPEASFPPAIQWVDRPAILFPLSNMILYGMGLTAGLFAWFAVVWAAWRVVSSVGKKVRRTQESATHWDWPEWMLHAIPLTWTLLYFLFMGTRWVKSVRYFLPIYPTLFVLAGWAIVELWRWASEGRQTTDHRPKLEEAGGRRSAVGRLAVALLAAAVVVPSLLWAVMYTQIYREPMTRIAASQWIYENVPSGATLLYDTADGQTRELHLPLKGMEFVFQGAPLTLNFSLPEDGLIRAVRFNYLIDPDFDATTPNAALGDSESIRVAINGGVAVEHPLQLDGERRAVIIELPPTPATADTPILLTAEAGPGGAIRAGTSLLVNEHWDDLLPVGLDGRNAYGAYYTEVTGGQRPVTHPDSPEKREEVIAWLDEADYIMISSQRAIWNLPRMALTYPMMLRYYEGLFNGELGFDLVAQFHGNTRLGPLYVSDTSAQVSWGQPPAIGWPPPGELAAEEAFSVYDHPPVWIFAKNANYSPENTRQVLESVDLSQVRVMNPLEATRATNGMMLSAADWATQRAGGTFSEVFAIDGVLSRNPWLAAVVWFLAVVLIGWIAFPLAFVALGGLPDRGYGLARVLGLLVVSYLTWLTASLKWLPHTRSTLLLSLLALAALSAVLLVRRRREIVAFISVRRRYILFVELLGLALFGLMVVIRLGNPDVWDVIWGGEKPMDLSYLTAVMRSTTFPPYDPWLAGGYLNYYYYGFVFVGALAKLLGVMPAVAYNLILPMLFSMTGVAVFSLAHSLVCAVGRFSESPAESGTESRRFGAPYIAGLVAVALALLLGNLAQPSVIANAWYQAGTPTLEELPIIGRAARTLDGGVKVLSGQPAPIYPGDWFWTASRALNYEPGEAQPITEFPFFTFLYGDLHAHMIAMPLSMLALGWAIGVVLLAERKRRGAGEQGRAGDPADNQQLTTNNWPLMFLTGALAIGVLRPTNTWDWPTYLLLGVLALAYTALQTDGLNLRGLGKAALLAVGLFGLSALLFLPYTANYGAAYSSVSLWPGSYTRAWNYLIVHGLFLFFVVTHLTREVRAWAATWTEEGKRRLEPLGRVIVAALVLFVVLTAALLVRGYWVAPIALPLLVVAGLLALRPGLATGRRVVLALMSAALGLTLLVEIIVLDGDVGRMNTVFKFYLQVWLMLSVACGPAAVWAWASIRRTKRLRVVWQGTLAVLLFAAFLYPLLATAAKWGIRMNPDAPNTLDGAAFLPYVEYGDTDHAGQGRMVRPAEDLGAIEWLQRNVSGSPVVMEAHGGNPYRSIAARIAMYTGLPSVVGWDWHQRQQRAVAPDTLVTSRIADVNTFYNTLDITEARNILARYGVEYIVVGSLENTYYWPEGQLKFDQMVAEGTLQEVFRDEFARILRVASDEFRALER